MNDDEEHKFNWFEFEFGLNSIQREYMCRERVVNLKPRQYE